MVDNRTMNNTTFQVGTTYTTTSIGDSECLFRFTVISRTAKFVTFDTNGLGIKRVGVRVWDDVEYALPLGRYSMAPSVDATDWAK